MVGWREWVDYGEEMGRGEDTGICNMHDDQERQRDGEKHQRQKELEWPNKAAQRLLN